VIVRLRSNGKSIPSPALQTEGADNWRMPPLEALPPARLTTLSRVWMIVLRAYLIVAAGLVLFRIVNLALGHA
jgi:hypothetical protein